MTITLEMIDELRKRANVSFEDAKDALEKCNGDLVDAIVYLEKNNKIKKAEEKVCFFDKIKRLIRKGNNIRFLVRKGENTILNLPLTISILIGIFAFYVVIIALIIALIAGYRFRFVKGSDK